MSSGRQLFDAIRGRGVAGRPPIAAAVDALAARVAGMSYEAMTSDVGAWATGIARTTELLGLDAVMIGFDFDLMREALGGDGWAHPETRGRLGVAVETAKRLFQVSRAEKGCIAAMVGPVTLAAQLFGEDEAIRRVAELKPVETAIATALCETRPDLLLFLERAPFGRTEIGTAERRAYNALKNIAGYYDVAPALWMEGYEPGHTQGLDRLGMAFVVPAPAAADPSRIETPGLGVVLPFDDPAAALAAARSTTTAGRARLFFMSRGALPPDTPIETVTQLVRDLRELSIQ